MKSFSPELAYFCLFIVSLWLSGTLFEELLRCRLVGELLIGLIFGNLAVGTLLPTDKTFLVLAGEVGVLGLVFEAGLGTDLHRVLKAGPRAALVAFVGIVVPLATGFGFIYGLSQQGLIQEMDSSTSSSSSNNKTTHNVIEAIASGASLASTSIAIAVTMMKQQGILDTPVGTLITTAAMLDDVVSLILLGIISSIGASESGSGSGIGPMTVIQPVLASLGIILVGVVGCAIAARVKTRKALNVRPALEMEYAQYEAEGADAGICPSVTAAKEGNGFQKGGASHKGIRTRVIRLYNRFASTIKLAGMVVAGLGYSILAEYLGSSRLLGAFTMGVFFSSFKNLRSEYEEQIIHKVQPVMSAIFFATIGFAIPLAKILDPVLFGWGLVYAAIASLSKLATMLVAPSKVSTSSLGSSDVGVGYNVRLLVGTAMIARGELGLLMVQQANLQGIMSQAAMVISTWSVVLSTLFGVGALGLVMKNNKEVK
ncbi:hypothetical protein BGZ51_008224 [Haplosporangium sp. Z 767]|nr:hypothetical protein BGZ50_008902 [Haplosporangium sp. Z 11]KAF9177992.1 hypothetical protein BGZ51_008224 [Haplosporangium sp. Z 767]